MANLLDTIRQNTSLAGTQKQGMTDETNRLATLLRAKSGKEVGGGDVVASNLGEQQAVASTNLAMQNQIAPAVQLQQAQSDIQSQQQQQQAQQQKEEIAQNRRFDTVRNRIQTNEILQNLEQNKGRLDQQQRDALTAQAAQNLRLQNDQYINNLQREGQKARLDSENSFNEQLARSTFADNQELLKTSLGNKSVLDASDNEFSKAMGQMSTQNAYDIFRNEMKAQKERGMYEALGGLVTAGVGAYGRLSEKKEQEGN